MPIIARNHQDVAKLEAGADPNRKEAKDAPGSRSRLCASIATFIPRKGLSRNGSDWTLQLPVSDLEQSVKLGMEYELKRKKKGLIEYYKKYMDKTKNNAALVESLNKKIDMLPWPDIKNMIVDFQVKRQPSLSNGTAFYIGDNRIATAGHLTGNLSTANCYVVFEYTADHLSNNKFEGKQIAEITKLLLKSVPAKAQGSNSSAPIAPSDYQAEYLEQYKGTLLYDFAIYEIKLLADHASMPDKLTISPKFAPQGEPVFLIGSPQGLPLKYVEEGRVLDAAITKTSHPRMFHKATPNEGGDLYKYGSLSTNLDTNSGNSGGPLFNGKNEVVGACQLGVSLALLPGDSQQLPTDASNPNRIGSTPLQQEINEHIKEVIKHSNPSQVAPYVDNVFVHSYVDYQTLDNVPNHIAYIRYAEESDVIYDLNRFTRIDPYCHMLESLDKFEKADPSRPSGKVTVKFVFKANIPNKPASGKILGADYQLTVFSQDSRLGQGGRSVSKSKPDTKSKTELLITYQYQGSNASEFKGPWTSSGGPLDWTNIVLSWDGKLVNSKDLTWTRTYVEVTFAREKHDLPHDAGWPAEVLSFRALLKATPGGQNALSATIGDRKAEPGVDAWKGPFDKPFDPVNDREF